MYPDIAYEKTQLSSTYELYRNVQLIFTSKYFMIHILPLAGKKALLHLLQPNLGLYTYNRT